MRIRHELENMPTQVHRPEQLPIGGGQCGITFAQMNELLRCLGCNPLEDAPCPDAAAARLLSPVSGRTDAAVPADLSGRGQSTGPFLLPQSGRLLLGALNRTNAPLQAEATVYCLNASPKTPKQIGDTALVQRAVVPANSFQWLPFEPVVPGSSLLEAVLRSSDECDAVLFLSVLPEESAKLLFNSGDFRPIP